MTKKTKIILGVVVAIFLVAMVSTISSDAKKYKDDKQTSTQTQQHQSAETQKPISAIQKGDIDGFKKTSTNKLSDGYVIASYLTGNDKISVTVSDYGDTSVHKDSGLYDTERTTTTIDGVEVAVGYSTPSEFANPYQSLAFDFKLGDFTYSGEVSHLGLEVKQSGDKQLLLENLTNFMKSLKKQV
jgi:lipopolysaccharide export LptBFGC system permease protein LptF